METINCEELLVSIVVPVYNSAEYLLECIRSLQVQTHGNVEIILVNDGSTDSSPEICNKAALRDTRIRVVHKDNGGLSTARNAGLEHASGTYVWMVDSDDWVEPNAVEELVAAALRHNVDCVRMGYFRSKPSGSAQVKEPLDTLISPGIYQSRTIFLDFLEGRAGAYACLLFLRRSLYSRVRFDEDIPFMEDRAFVARLLSLDLTVLWFPTPLYHYRLNEMSLSYAPQTKAWKIESFARASARACEDIVALYPHDSPEAQHVSKVLAETFASYVVACVVKKLVERDGFNALSETPSFRLDVARLSSRTKLGVSSWRTIVLKLLNKGYMSPIWRTGRLLSPLQYARVRVRRVLD